MERTPWTFDAMLAIASKIRSGNGPLSSTFYKCLEEAQGIARSSLFGPIVRKEAVMGESLSTASYCNNADHFPRNAASGRVEYKRMAS